MAMGQTIYNQYNEESIKDAPDGYYVAHVDHDDVNVQRISKVAKLIILAKHGDDIYAPPVGSNYRGHIYMLEGPINRVEFTDSED